MIVMTDFFFGYLSHPSQISLDNFVEFILAIVIAIILCLVQKTLDDFVNLVSDALEPVERVEA